MLASVIILGAAAFFAVALTRSRPLSEDGAARRDAALGLALATSVQAVHFVEEAATGFHERFPVLFGLPPIPFPVFLSFNLAWLAIWAASVLGLRSGRAGALFAAWFLAIAGGLNGIGHPLLAVVAGGYFPGLLSSPFMGVAAGLLWVRLRRATRPERTQAG